MWLQKQQSRQTTLTFGGVSELDSNTNSDRERPKKNKHLQSLLERQLKRRMGEMKKNAMPVKEIDDLTLSHIANVMEKAKARA